LRKRDLAEIGEPIRAERKDENIEEGAARWGKGLTCPDGEKLRERCRAPAVRGKRRGRPEARRGLRRRAEVRWAPEASAVAMEARPEAVEAEGGVVLVVEAGVLGVESGEALPSGA
jgi:hypothetical protein